jgi:hypothetical protein
VIPPPRRARHNAGKGGAIMRIPSRPEEIEDDVTVNLAWTLIGLLVFIAACVYFFPYG